MDGLYALLLSEQLPAWPRLRTRPTGSKRITIKLMDFIDQVLIDRGVIAMLWMKPFERRFVRNEDGLSSFISASVSAF